MMRPVEWASAQGVDEVLGAAAQGAVIKAGGVDLVDLMKEGLVAPARLVNLRGVRGLDRIDGAPGQGMRFGPLVTLARIADEPMVHRRLRALADACGKAATPQIRNMATIAGNLLQRPRCWYFRSEAFPCRRKGGARCFAVDGENQHHAIFDNGLCAIVHPSSAATALVALGATLTIRSARAEREATVESIFVAPGTDVTREHSVGPSELITEVRVPDLAPGAASAYGKIGEKESFDWPEAEVAWVIERAGDRCAKASVVLGAAAPTPHRARAAEEALRGKPLTEETARAAAKAAVQGATPLSGNAHKLTLFEVLLRRTLLAAMTEGGR